MIRPELIVAGCILVVLGLVLCVVGYQKTQPTAADAAVGFLEQVSQQRAPRGLKTDKTPGYLLMGAGGVAVAGGIALVLFSRSGTPGG